MVVAVTGGVPSAFDVGVVDLKVAVLKNSKIKTPGLI